MVRSGPTFTRPDESSSVPRLAPSGLAFTPAAQKIPGYDRLSEAARTRNPGGRMTTTDDVARAIVVLSHPDTYWMTGNVIGVDGGEDIVG